MRLFVAIEVGDAVREQAAALIRMLQQRTVGSGAKVTWMTAERMHLTVRFIGQVPDVTSARIETALVAPVPMMPFEIMLKGVAVLPPRGRPRVIMARVHTGAARLQHLEQAISARLGGVGVPREHRPYLPHLTLARVRESRELRIREVFEGLDDRAVGTTKVEAITLFESRLSSRGPSYVPLQRTELKPSE